ncbi:ankyrin repeat domain 34Bb isoform X2 [Stigmatopora argus]
MDEAREGGAYVNESNEHGETPLMVACKSRHMDTQSVAKHKMVQYLLENGADPNIQDKSGKTALMHACLGQDGTEILSLLLRNGADPTLEDHSGSSALVYAINSGNRGILKILLDACKANGKEVIIITTNKLPCGQQTTKQYLNVPPPADQEDPHCTQTCSSPFENQQEGSNPNPAPQPDSPLFAHKKLSISLDRARPDSPSPLSVPSGDKKLILQRWVKSSTPLLQKSHTSLLAEEQVESTMEEVSPFRSLNVHSRASASLCHHCMDTKEGLPKALDNIAGGQSGRGFARKMSYDSVASAQHSTSHPNLHQHNNLPFAHETGPADGDASDGQLNVSSLQNVIHRRNIGVDHYSSDSQLPQFGGQDSNCLKKGVDRPKLTNSKSSIVSGSRESVGSFSQRRGVVGLDRRGSGPLLQDHISSTRPGYLPSLNPHAPIPDIGANSVPLCSGKTPNILFKGSKPILPCLPCLFPRDSTSKMLWRRHSMQIDQIKQLSDFEEKLTFD